MGVPNPMNEHPPLSFPYFPFLDAGRRQEGTAHADGPHLEDGVAEGRQRSDQTNEESLRSELGERDFFGAGPLAKEGRDLREGRGGRVDLEKLQEATG